LRPAPEFDYRLNVTKKASVGLVFDVAPDVLLAGAQAPPLGKTCPSVSDVMYWISQATALDIVEEPEPVKRVAVIE